MLPCEPYSDPHLPRSLLPGGGADQHPSWDGSKEGLLEPSLVDLHWDRTF